MANFEKYASKFKYVSTTDNPPKIVIVTDSGSDLPEEFVKENNITVIQSYIQFGAETYTNSDINPMKFLEMAENATKRNFPKTSQPSAQDFMEAYETLKGQGVETILSVHISLKLSGTINSANVAAGMLDGIDIKIIDSHGVSINLGACVMKAAKMLKSGADVDIIVKDVEAFGANLKNYGTLSTLDNLVRGGRMSPLRYRFGKFLNIKPILKIGQDKVEPAAKARGIEKSRAKMYKLALKNIDAVKPVRYYVAHSDLKDEAIALEKRFKSDFPKAQGTVTEIGALMSVHTGRGCLMLLTWNE